MPKLIEQPLVILGFGGHARSVGDLAVACGYQRLIFVDKNAKNNEKFCQFDVLTTLPHNMSFCFLAAGNNALREKQLEFSTQHGLILVNLISPSSTLGLGAALGNGCFIGYHAHIGPMATIGTGCIINTAAVVEHDCTVGNFSHIAVNATIAGAATLGHHVFIGAGAVVKDGVSIADNVTVGAGATVVGDLTCAGVYIGTPARLISTSP